MDLLRSAERAQTQHKNGESGPAHGHVILHSRRSEERPTADERKFTRIKAILTTEARKHGENQNLWLLRGSPLQYGLKVEGRSWEKESTTD
jgi:hypothetical protein